MYHSITYKEGVTIDNMNNLLDEFGKTLMSDVRDRTIRVFDKRIQGLMKDETSLRLYERISSLDNNQKKLIEDIIPMVVDLSIHNMLCMLEDNEDFALIKDSENIAELSDGLSGELYTEDGWISKYSEQRRL